MARNHRTALYLNDPVKVFGGMLSWKQGGCLVGELILCYALVEVTKALPYGQSTVGQLHLLLVLGVPAFLGFLTFALLGKGAVEPYPKQLSGYVLRQLAAVPARLQTATASMRLPSVRTDRPTSRHADPTSLTTPAARADRGRALLVKATMAAHVRPARPSRRGATRRGRATEEAS